MLPLSFPLRWRSSFGDSLPAGFHCRASLSDRWLRVHSLPESKRYAETEAERSELLHRQNAVATYLLGDGAHCELLVTRFGEKSEWLPWEELPLNGKVPEHVMSAAADGDELQFFALPVVWQSNAFNDLILAIADDRTGPVLFADMQRSCIYAPYDGGADLFFRSQHDSDVARVKFQVWLSNREDGL